MNKKQKPITVAREEFVQSLVKLCNDAEIPYFCVEEILKEVLKEVHTASIQQYQNDLQKYNSVVNDFDDGINTSEKIENKVED